VLWEFVVMKNSICWLFRISWILHATPYDVCLDWRQTSLSLLSFKFPNQCASHEFQTQLKSKRIWITDPYDVCLYWRICLSFVHLYVVSLLSFNFPNQCASLFMLWSASQQNETPHFIYGNKVYNQKLGHLKVSFMYAFLKKKTEDINLDQQHGENMSNYSM